MMKSFYVFDPYSGENPHLIKNFVNLKIKQNLKDK